MRINSLMIIAAIVSMSAMPAIAAPINSAAKLSPTKNIRAGAPMRHGNKANGSSLLIAGALIAAVVIGAVALGHNDNDRASS